MTRSLTLVTAPATEPVSLTEAKAWARIDTSDEDALITGLITMARQSAEAYTRRSFITQTHKLTLDLPTNGFANNLPAGVYDLPVSALFGDLPASVYLPKGPVSGITSVVTYDTVNDGSTWDPANYFLDSAGDRLVLNSSAAWPSPLRMKASVAITFTAGYGGAAAVPQAIKQAIMIHVASLYETRGVCSDMDLPPAAKQLLRLYRLEGERYV